MSELETDEETKEVLELLDSKVSGFAQDLGLEIVEIKIIGKRKPRICIFVDTPEGVTARHCARLSKKISYWVDEELEGDLFQGAYHLEVSSPGLDRPFTRTEDYVRNQGRRIQIQLKEALKGGLEKFKGVLSEVEGDEFEIKLDDGSIRKFRYEDVRKAHQAIDF